MSTEASRVWQLGITETQFADIYGDLIANDSFYAQPTSDVELIELAMSKLWRLNNLYYIINKQGKKILFRMNYAQHVVYAASLLHPRLIILKSRQQGISTFWLVSYLDDALIFPNYNIGMMAQGLTEAGTLLKRVQTAWEDFPPVFTQFLELRRIKDTGAEQGWCNNSYVFIRTSFRSTTLQRLHISEFGKIAKNYPDRAKETKTGTLQAIAPGNTVVIESTAEGDNEFKTMWDNAVFAEVKMLQCGADGVFAEEDFKPVFLSWVNDPDCQARVFEKPSQTEETYFTKIEDELGVVLTREQKNFWISKHRTLGEEMYQEYPATPEEAFTKVNNGSYYGTLYAAYIVKKGRRIKDLYDPMLDVFVVMDLGINDTFSIGYFQRFRDEWRVIDEYSNSGEGLSHYVDKMNDSGYEIATVYAPHDITVQELGTGKSRLAVLHELGVRNVVVLPKLGLTAGIEQVRKIIPSLWIDEKCVYVDGCIKNYSKDWDDKLQTWKSSPRHDKWSHGADMVRYMAVSSASHTTRRTRERDRRAIGSMVDGLAM